MIIETLLNIVFGIVQGILFVLPDVTWNCDEGLMASFIDFIGVILYLFPIGTVGSIISLVLILNLYKITISLLKTIWDILPFV